MNFLAPLFLTGAAAVLLPLLFHLVRHSASRKTTFSSLMFLRLLPPRLTRRNRLEHLLLLLLRGAVVVLLAVAFARPFLRKASTLPLETAPPKRVVVLVDTSASMRRAGLWPAACRRAEDVAQNASVADELTLLAFDAEVKPLITFEQWRETPPRERTALLRQRLSETEPGWARTGLDRALIRAVELFEAIGTDRPGSVTQQIILVSDFAQGCHLDELAGYKWPSEIRVLVERLEPRESGNAGLHIAAESGATGHVVSGTVRVRVTRADAGPTAQFRVGWADRRGNFVATPVPVALAGGQERLVSVPVVPSSPDVDRLMIEGDKDEFDNSVFVVPQEQERVTVLYFGREPAGDTRQPLYFLQRAFPSTQRLAVEVAVCAPDLATDESLLDKAALFVITDMLDQGLAKSLRARLARGGIMLFAPRGAADVSMLSELLGCGPVEATESRFEPYGLLGEIDFKHPLFAPFADQRFSDFTKVRFWKHRFIDMRRLPDSRVAAAFDNGVPAIIDVPSGSGRVLVFAAGWHPTDSQLALSSKFVPLMHAALDLSSARLPASPHWGVGDAVPVARLTGPGAGLTTVLGPDGSTARLSESQDVYSGTRLPGIYRVERGGVAARFAVNLDASESRTTPLEMDALEKLGVNTAAPESPAHVSMARQVRLQDAETESHQGLWRWFIVAALVVLLVESLLAGRAARLVVGQNTQSQ